MLIKSRPGWEIPESEATSETVFMDRRRFIAAGAGLIAGAALPEMAFAQGADPTLDLYPAKRNAAYTLDRPVTEEELAANYNNFYEFGTSKDVVASAKRLSTRPWTVTIDGLVEKPIEIGIDELIRKMPLEERRERHAAMYRRLETQNVGVWAKA